MGQTTPKEHDELRRAMNPLLNQASIEENAKKLYTILKTSLEEWEREGISDAAAWCRSTYMYLQVQGYSKSMTWAI